MHNLNRKSKQRAVYTSPRRPASASITSPTPLPSPQVLAQLDEWCRSYPDFNNYLAFIFSHGDGFATEVRQGAGLLLKNNLRSQQQAPTAAEHRSYVKTCLLTALRLPDRPLRHTAGTCIVTVVGAEGPTAWPELTPALAEALDAKDAATIDGALDTLYKLWEDVPHLLEMENPPGSGHRSSDALVPRAMTHFSSPDAATRALAVSCTNLAAGYMPPSLMGRLEVFLQGLFLLASDASAAVRKAVCAGFVQLVSVAPDRLEPQLGGIIEYMLSSSQDPDGDVAVEATEFWSAYPESGLDVAALRPYLPRLLPVLLKNMVFDEYDEEVADAEADEEAALSGRPRGAEKDSEVRPHLHSAAAHGAQEADEDADDEDDEEVRLWNLRRCSAAGLDMLSAAFGDELLPLLLPAVQERLAQPDWRAREGAILALGAVSEGCAGGLAAHVPGIIGAVLPGLLDPRPMVRCISCWALTRYSRGLLDRASAGDRSTLDTVIVGVCDRVGDHNRKVQEAACGSVASFLDEAGETAQPYAPRLLAALGSALQTYGRRTLRYAYDAVATVAEKMPSALATPEGAAFILPHLFSKLAALPDGDREILPLLECVSTVAQVSGQQMQAYAEGAFNRCVDMADRMHAAAASGAYDKEEADEFVVSALDAVSGLVEGLGAGVESLVGRSALRDVLLQCCTDASPDVRQSAFALVGDLARTCMPHLRPALGGIAAAALANLEPGAITHMSLNACNNAAWSLGEIAIALPPGEVSQFALPALERLVPILAAPSGGLPRSLVENAAITLGRIAWVCPGEVAPHCTAFLGPWCVVLRAVRDGTEKEHAFLGLCAVLRANPDGGNAVFTSLCEAIVSWRELKCEGLRNELQQLVAGYRDKLVALGQWDVALASLSPAAQQKLVAMFQLR